jgi:hypothetical protein
LTADLLGEFGSDPVAEEGGDVFGFDSEDGLPGKLLIKGLRMGERSLARVCARSQSSMRRKAAPAPARRPGKGETGSESAGQPAMAVAIELEVERTPCRHAQIDQAQFGIDEVEVVVVQTFAGIRPQEGAMRLFPDLAWYSFSYQNNIHGWMLSISTIPHGLALTPDKQKLFGLPAGTIQ